MELNKFAETYFELEEKVHEIMKIYDIEHYSLDAIDVENHQNKILLNIYTSYYTSACGNDTVYLTFELNEMNNDLEYFKTKRKKQLEEIEAKNKKHKAKLQKEIEAKELEQYKKLKQKYE